MPDPALKEKAKEMFVVNGFSMDTIAAQMEGQISRKTLYNWRNKENWEDQRRERVASTSNRRERLEGIIDRALDELEVVFDPKLLFAIGKAVAALKQMSTFEFTEEKKEKDDNRSKGLTEDKIKEIEEKLNLL